MGFLSGLKSGNGHGIVWIFVENELKVGQTLFKGLRMNAKSQCVQVKLTVAEPTEKSRKNDWPRTHTDAHRYY
jgi:hypothetical protein